MVHPELLERQNADLVGKSVEDPPYGPSELNTRVLEISSNRKELRQRQTLSSSFVRYESYCYGMFQGGCLTWHRNGILPSSWRECGSWSAVSWWPSFLSPRTGSSGAKDLWRRTGIVLRNARCYSLG